MKTFEEIRKELEDDMIKRGLKSNSDIQNDELNIEKPININYQHIFDEENNKELEFYDRLKSKKVSWKIKKLFRKITNYGKRIIKKIKKNKEKNKMVNQIDNILDIEKKPTKHMKNKPKHLKPIKEKEKNIEDISSSKHISNKQKIEYLKKAREEISNYTIYTTSKAKHYKR